MSNAVAEVNRWSAAAVNWGANSTSTGLSYGINQKLRDWIAVVNGNASNTDKQIQMWKDETSSLSASYQGMVLRLFHNNTEYWHAGVYGTNSTLSKTLSVDWNDNGSNDGYGTYNSSDYYVIDASSFSGSGSNDVDLLVAYDTTDGEEFFQWTWVTGTSADEDYVLIYKNNYGHWACIANDGSNQISMMYSTSRARATFHENYKGTQNNFPVDSFPLQADAWSRIWFPAPFVNDDSYKGRTVGGVWPASGHIYAYGAGDRAGRWFQLKDANGNAIAQHMLCFGPYAPWIRIGGDF